MDGDHAQDFGTGRLALADSRFALAMLNHGRRWAVGRVFGLSGPQADMLSFAVALGAAEVALQALRRPFPLTKADAAMGTFGLREGIFAIAGPAARETPGFAGLVLLAVVGGVGIPGLRRARRNLRDLELRVRSERIRRYRSALEAARAATANR